MMALKNGVELVEALRYKLRVFGAPIESATNTLMSDHLALPRIGHIEQVIHMFGYLKLHPKRKIVFDAAHPIIDERIFKKYDWYDFYRGAKEAIPFDCPEPLGNSISTHFFCRCQTCW